MRKVIALLLLIAGTAAFAQAVHAREQRWAAEITPAILVGDPVMLTLPSGRRFLAIHAPNAKARAGVIAVHGRGVHPDWGLVNPLRSESGCSSTAHCADGMPDALKSRARANRSPA